MLDYSMIAKVAVTPSSDEANRLLKDWWTLLDLYHDTDGTLLFVLGSQRSVEFDAIRGFALAGKEAV